MDRHTHNDMNTSALYNCTPNHKSSNELKIWLKDGLYARNQEYCISSSLGKETVWMRTFNGECHKPAAKPARHIWVHASITNTGNVTKLVHRQRCIYYENYNITKAQYSTLIHKVKEWKDGLRKNMGRSENIKSEKKM